MSAVIPREAPESTPAAAATPDTADGRAPGAGGDFLRRALAGDPAGWDQLVRQYTPYLLRVAASYRIGDEAQDAVQNTFVRLFENGAAIRNPDAVKAWLATTAQNECLKILRRRDRERPTAIDNDWDDLLPTSTEPSTEDQIVRRDEYLLVDQAMATLPDRERELLIRLSDPDTDEYRSVSEHLGMPMGSIGPTRQRSLRRVRHTLVGLGLRDCA